MSDSFWPYYGWGYWTSFLSWWTGTKLSPYHNFFLRKARVTKLCNYMHLHVCFQNIYKKIFTDISIFLMMFQTKTSVPDAAAKFNIS